MEITMPLPIKQFPQVGDLIKVVENKIYDPYGISNQMGIVIQDGRQTAKVRWLNPKPNKPLESWVHYNRLRKLEYVCNN
jgi:hypothetical protein